MKAYQKQFIKLAIETQMLQFGDFTLKSGLKSPYFFNVGKLNTGADWLKLSQCYAAHLIEEQLSGDVLFGPAYKGIPIVSCLALTLSQQYEQNFQTTYNRKEAKDHGEGGVLVGAELINQSVLLIDDVLTKGTAISQVKTIVESAGGKVTGILVAMDRCQTHAEGGTVQRHLADSWNIPVQAIVSILDVIEYLRDTDATQAQIISDYCS